MRFRLLSILAGLLLCAPSSALTITFSKVADTGTAIPGGTGSFTGFSTIPSVDGGRVALRGTGSSGQLGLYTDDGVSLAKVVDLNTAIPDGTGNFTNFGSASLDAGRVAFTGVGSSGQTGIYTDASGSLAKAVDTNTGVPGGSGNFTAFGGGSSFDAGKVAFRGDGSSGQRGIYTDAGGSLVAAADKNTAIPSGTGNFTDFAGAPSLDAGKVAFHADGGSGQQGIYTDAGGSLAAVADTGTAIPSGTGNFTSFGDQPALDAGSIVFKGSGSGQDGIYTAAGVLLAAVANTNTVIPEGTGSFTSFSNAPSIDGGNVAFRGSGSGQQGIYAEFDGTLIKVIALSDSLDGKTLSFLSSGREALSGSNLAFYASFTDGSSGIFLATIPEPSSALLLAAGLAGMAAAGRRRLH